MRKFQQTFIFIQFIIPIFTTSSTSTSVILAVPFHSFRSHIIIELKTYFTMRIVIYLILLTRKKSRTNVSYQDLEASPLNTYMKHFAAFAS